MENLFLDLKKEVLVKVKDAGIVQMVKKNNHLLPIEEQKSFTEIKSEADKNGYHTMTGIEMIDYFGNVSGMFVEEFINSEILTPHTGTKKL